MPEPCWKPAERRLAAFFGSVRRSLSGGNSKTGRDDSMHPRLFISSKYGKYVPLFRLYREEREKARKEKKTPVIGLQEKSKPGILIVIHSDDFPAVVKEWLETLDRETLVALLPRDPSLTRLNTYIKTHMLRPIPTTFDGTTNQHLITAERLGHPRPPIAD